MKPGIGLAFVSVFIELVLVYIILFYRLVSPDFEYVLMGLVLMNLIGALMMLTPLRKEGAIIVFVFSLAFIPIGFIGLLGARSSLNYLKRKEFELTVYGK